MRYISVALLLGLIPACTPPRGTALQRDIVQESEEEDASFEMVAVNKTSLARVSDWPATGQGLGLSWPGKGQSQPSRALRPDDTINLTIWDSAPNSLLTAVEQRAAAMHGLVISPDGTIFVPYIDKVQVAGLTPEAARADIQDRLTRIAPSAQVLLDVQPGDNNMIELVSGVAKPGRYPVAARGATILSILAEAGGIPDAMRNPVVRLQRGGTAHATLVSDLYDTPAKDILLRGGDRVVVESDPRSFVLMGATGSERIVPFEKVSHDLLEALSLGNGLNEGRANIRAILVLRKYPAKALKGDGSGPRMQQVIFTFDLGTADGLFAASSFRVNPDDVILATESPIPSANSVLGLFGATLGVARSASAF